MESQCPTVTAYFRDPVASLPLYFFDPHSPPSGLIAFSYSPRLPGSPTGPGSRVGSGGPFPQTRCLFPFFPFVPRAGSSALTQSAPEC